MEARPQHVAVLSEQVSEFLNIRWGGVYLDATLGFAGHAGEIIRRLGSQGKLIAFDRDPAAMEQAAKQLERMREELRGEMPQLEIHATEFSAAKDLIVEGSLDGVLADFGVSSMQIDQADRGFSFQADGPLDMRMNPRIGRTAEQVVNQTGEKELADLIYEFGEERRSRRIARAIVRARPISTTAQLAKVISAAAPAMKQARGRHSLHPATRTFQAIRIRVNSELDEIEALLQSAPKLLRPGGRLVAISFHSLEDRLVKDAMRDGARDAIWKVLTKKPVTAEEEEQRHNPRSRSAKLRAAERL